MTEAMYFENVKTKKRYKVLDMEEVDGGRVVRLQGPNRAFNERYDKERFKQLGYKLVTVEETDEEDT